MSSCFSFTLASRWSPECPTKLWR